MKDILIDLYKLKEIHTGLGQFSKNFGKHIISNLKGLSITFLVDKKNASSFSTSNVKLRKASFLSRYFPSLTENYNIWHSIYQMPPFRPNKNTTWILTIHDLNFLIEKKGSKKEKYLKKLQRDVDRADYITTISNFSKSEIEKNLDLGNKKVMVIYNGVEFGDEIEKIKPDFITDEKYFFSIGHFTKKKNFEVLVPIMNNFPDYKLVIAGNSSTKYGNEIREKIKELNLEDRIVLPGEITQSNRQWLYANCEAFLFPSIAEGFGLPVIEAMNEGRPVFLSKHTSLPEIGGELAFYFDDFDVENMSELIEKKLKEIHSDFENYSVAVKKHSSKFSWENSINQYIELYKEILNSKS